MYIYIYMYTYTRKQRRSRDKKADNKGFTQSYHRDFTIAFLDFSYEIEIGRKVLVAHSHVDAEHVLCRTCSVT